VLVVGVLAGLLNVAFVLFVMPEQFMLASDVYRHAADAMLAGDAFYSVSPPRLPGYTFIYPPVVVFAFVPHALLDSAVGAYAIQTALNVAFGLGTTLLVARALNRRGVTVGTADRLVIGAFVLLSAHSAITLVNGQVTVWLGFAVALGLWGLDAGRERLAGVAFALTALVKVFPAAFGLWFLRQRAWRAVAAAVLTGLGGLAVGALVLGPDTTVAFFQNVLLDRFEGETFAGRPAPTDSVGGAQRQIAALTGLGSPLLPAFAALVVGIPLWILYGAVDTDRGRLAAALGTIVATLLVLPLQRLYMPLFAFPLVVLLYASPPDRARQVLFGGLLCSYVRTNHDVATATIEGLGLPTGIETTLVGASELLFTFVLPPTLGLWLVLAGCVLAARAERGQSAGH